MSCDIGADEGYDMMSKPQKMVLTAALYAADLALLVGLSVLGIDSIEQFARHWGGVALWTVTVLAIAALLFLALPWVGLYFIYRLIELVEDFVSHRLYLRETKRLDGP
jgi:hypothetical protein